jgi:hypothetical protein
MRPDDPRRDPVRPKTEDARTWGPAARTAAPTRATMELHHLPPAEAFELREPDVARAASPRADAAP